MTSKARGLANLGNAYDDGALSNRNLVINGAMQVAQRGTSFTANGYGLDRWNVYEDTTGVLYNSQSSDAPVGFSNSATVTVNTSATVSATNLSLFRQPVEGLNVSHLNWGTANAQSITLSFWVKSSLTGAFGGAIQNSAANRCYPFTYNILLANTWEYKTILIEGDTTGTWLTTNGVGIYIQLGLGVGSTYSGTAGSWSSSLYFSSTGAVKLIETGAATWQITGVQLEVGDTATPFEHRSYGDELARCQRYFCYSNPAEGANPMFGSFLGYAENTTRMDSAWVFPVKMRAAPTVTKLSAYIIRQNNNQTITSCSFDSTTSESTWILSTGTFVDQSVGRVYSTAPTPTFSADAEL